MSRVQLKWWCVLALVTWVPVTLYAAHQSFYGAYIDLPEEWAETTQPTPNERYFRNPETTATLNISYYRTESLTNVHALAQYRVIGRFDGWETMLDRPTRPEETKRVGAREGRIVVYSRQTFQENSLRNDIVGEYYYFVSPNIGYVISVETVMPSWREVQSVFRKTIDSFGIGRIPTPNTSSANR